eukprot:TRINITY_DN306_c0_g5_i1.p1 TRINITY_DN306_c0_g5~~TRINITY_DN306_c0_g5_i1.p1  ORF type:complete len:479 (+),score=128.53 TRINITY_DN306_c0_g5_i1:85-1437(+)
MTAGIISEAAAASTPPPVDGDGLGLGVKKRPLEDVNLQGGDSQQVGVELIPTDGSDEKRKWPGWPGDNVFRLIVQVHKVGGIIGRRGEFVKRICEQTHARIKILDGIPGTDERVVMVSGKEVPDADIPPAVEAFLRVHKRLVDGSTGAESGSWETLDNAAVFQQQQQQQQQGRAGGGAHMSTRLLVAATQAGSLIGRQGLTIRAMQDDSGAHIRILPTEQLPLCALEDDRVVEVTGEPNAVHTALKLITLHLRRFLLDFSVLPLFEYHRASSALLADVSGAMMLQSPPDRRGGVGTATAGGGGALQWADAVMRGSAIGTPVSASVAALGRGASPYSAPKVSATMQIPLSYVDAIIGAQGANIVYLRRTSGATVTIQESRNASGQPDMTIEVRGSATQVQLAQQLIESFMNSYNAAAAAAPSASAAEAAQAAVGQSSGQYASDRLYGSRRL